MTTSASPQDLAPLTGVSKITGIGSAFPEKILTNFDLEKMVQTSDAWIRERTGIQTRRISEPGRESEFNSSLGCAASIRALEMAGKKPEDIDAIFYSTCTPDTIIPSTSCWLQKKLGATRAWALDLNAACSGFVFALITADQFIRNGTIRTALVVGADVLSSFTNWEDRSSCILFGDGAGAAVVEWAPSSSTSRIMKGHLGSDGQLWEVFHMPAGGSRLEVTPEVYAQRLHKMQMKGPEIFKIAVRKLSEYAQMAADSNGIKIEDIDWVIPHQANLRIIEAVARRLGIPMEKVITNIEDYGNNSSATVPGALDQAVRSGKIKRGQWVLMDVFGAGTTYGSLLIRW